VFDHSCFSDSGNPCPNQAICSESSDTCGGCNKPTVVASGARYLTITPMAQGTNAVALLVTGDCDDPATSCVSAYVQSPILDEELGTFTWELGPSPVYKRTDQPRPTGWGTVHVQGKEIRPESRYAVHAMCNFAGGVTQSAAGRATTWMWADADHNSTLNILDVATIVDAFKGLFSPTVTFEATNLWDCDVDALINILDVAAGVDAFRGFGYACDAVCP
jgi:hypothetical protein